MRLTVDLERPYPIVIERGVLGRLEELEGVVITDNNVGRLYSKKLGIEPVISVPAGEKSKSMKTYEDALQQMAELKLNRDTTVIALGGGVVGDLAGFCAATYMRGVRFIQIPTSLLSQVDSSIGGKTGINIPQGKNLVGAFHQPEAVYIDPDTLDTLPEKELRAGMVELVKHSLIQDRELFSYLETNLDAILGLDKEKIQTAIHRSLRIKKRIVEEDEKEKGKRSLLNYGHTFGHAIESLNRYRITHAEAVLAGMILAARLSAKLGILSSDDLRMQNSLLQRIMKPDIERLDAEDMLEEMAKDKKHAARPRYILLKGIGNAAIEEDVPEKTVREVLEAWL